MTLPSDSLTALKESYNNARLQLGKLLFRQDLGDRIVRVSLHRVVKRCRPTELEALRYVATHTSVPVPRVFSVFTQKRDPQMIYVEMEYIRGGTLAAAWDNGTLTPEQRAGILTEIGHAVAELRALPPLKEGLVSSAEGNALHDPRISMGLDLLGPFASVAGFHEMLRGGISLEAAAKTFGADVAALHSRSFRTFFSHADLAPRNIIIQHGRLAAIIDWEAAGWYPEYWEFRKLSFTTCGLPEWVNGIPVDRYIEENMADMHLWLKLDDPTYHHQIVQGIL